MANKKYISLVMLTLLLSASCSVDKKKTIDFPSIKVSDTSSDDALKNETEDNKKEDDDSSNNKNNKYEEVKKANASDFVYELNVTNSEVTIINSANKTLTKINIPSILTINDEDYTVTRIADNAFAGCNALKEVTIPKSIEQIGTQAFAACSNLTSFYVSDLNPYFASQDGIIYNYNLTELLLCPAGYTKEVQIPNSLTYIGAYALANCSKITEVSIPKSVTSIREGAFFNCSALKDISLPPYLTTIGAGAFSKTGISKIAIPKTVTYIGPWAFKDCTSLISFVYPDAVTSISYMTFSGCSNLNYVYIPTTMTTIEHNAFLNCVKLKRVFIPKNVTTVAKNAFKGINKTDALIEVEAKILPDTFDQEFNPEEIEVELSANDNDKVFTYENLRYKPLNDTQVKIIGFDPTKKVADLLIPQSITYTDNSDANNPVSKTYDVVEIQDNAFRNENVLKTVTIASTVMRNLGRHTFENSSLTKLTAPESSTVLTDIPEYCFAGSKMLTVAAKNSLGSIRYLAPYSFANIQEIRMDSGAANASDYQFFTTKTAVITIDSYAFDSTVVRDSDLYNSYEGKKRKFFDLQESIGQINSYAFSEATFGAINLPSFTKKIGTFALHNVKANGIYSIRMAGSYTAYGGHYSVLNNCLYKNNDTGSTIDTLLFRTKDYLGTSPSAIEASKNVKIASATKNISPYAFDEGTGNIESIIIEGSNSIFFVENNILYKKETISDENGNSKEIVTLLLAPKTLTGKIKISDKTTHIANNAFKDCTNITQITGNDSLVSVGNSAFEGCTSLVFATFKDGLKSIGRAAFKGCSALTKPTLPLSIKSLPADLFNGCTSLKMVNLPRDIEEIGDNSFNGCSNLTTIHLPNTLVDIGNNAFTGCSKLSTMTFDDDNQTYLYLNGVLYLAKVDPTTNQKYPDTLVQAINTTSITIPKTVTNVKDSAYDSFKNLTKISVESGNKNYSINSYGDLYQLNASGSMYKLLYHVNRMTTTSYVSADTSEIADAAYMHASSLTGIAVASSNAYFANYHNMLFSKDGTTVIKVPAKITFGSTGLDFGSNATKVLPGALKDNEWLKKQTTLNFTSSYNVSFPKGEFKDLNITVLYNINQNILESFYDLFNTSLIRSIQIQHVSNIPDGFFQGLDNLETFTITDYSFKDVTIGNSAFKNCKSLKTLTVSTKLVSIGDNAFEGCSALTTIKNELTDSSGVDRALVKLKNIGKNAFKDCTSLTTVDSKSFQGATNLTSIGEGAFKNCTSLVSFPLPQSSNYTTIEKGLFEGCSKLTMDFYNMKTYIKEIKADAFKGTAITSFYIPDDIDKDKVDFSAFDDTVVNLCASSTNNLKYISTNGVLYYNNFKELIRCPAGKTGTISIKDETTTIAKDAFKNCTKVTKLITGGITVTDSIKSGLNDVPANTFKGMTSLTNVTLGNQYLLNNYRNLFDITKVTTVAINRRITTITASAFENATGLVSITGGVSASSPDDASFITSIGNNAFKGCTNLTTFFIDAANRNLFTKLTNIGTSAFENCNKLSALYIPKSVRTMGSNAVKGCNKSMTIYNYSSRFTNNTTWNPDGINYRSM